MTRIVSVARLGTQDIRQFGPFPRRTSLIVTAARSSGQLSSSQEEMLLNALELDNITARQVTVPRPRIFLCPPISAWMRLWRARLKSNIPYPGLRSKRGPEYIVSRRPLCQSI